MLFNKYKAVKTKKISKTKSNTFRSEISKCIFLFEGIYFLADLKTLLRSKCTAKT